MTSLARRWIKFNFVGAIGFGVQMGAFAVLYGILGIGKLWATGLAVETAVLHNFVWHEKFTWRHLPRGGARGVLGRMLRFHAGNGLISIGGNVLLVKLFADLLHINPYFGNVLAIALCALANFAVSEWYVFRAPR
ncbi:MAG: GtrA family protein [Acidobacteria bacterium]|nr:GtrA family protein [Acidobacteriota bacterium]